MEWATADLRCAAEPRPAVQFSSEFALPPQVDPGIGANQAWPRQACA